MKKKVYSLWIIILFTIILNGCSNNIVPNNTFNTSQNNTSVETQIKNYIKEHSNNTDINNLSIVNRNSIDDNEIILMSLFNIGQDQYEGLFQYYQDKKSILYGNYAKIDASVPFTHHEMSGKCLSSNNTNTPYLVVSGKINNSNIISINVSFSDNSLVQSPIDKNQNTYMCVKNNKLLKVNSIEALDKDNKSIYLYNWNK